MRKHKLTLKTTINFRFYLLIVQVNEMIFMSSLCVCSNSKKKLQNNLFRSYFMIINERNNIVKYSIICMFRKHFEGFVPFSEIIFVLLQAYSPIL
mgnify:CR=1 FL=1